MRNPVQLPAKLPFPISKADYGGPALEAMRRSPVTGSRACPRGGDTQPSRALDPGGEVTHYGLAVSVGPTSLSPMSSIYHTKL